MNAQVQAQLSPGRNVDPGDIQGLVRFGFKHHTEAVFLLLRVREAQAARAWLAGVSVTSAVEVKPLPDCVLQIALTSDGLRALGVSNDIVDGFSQEFLDGMAGDPSRARRLGDEGPSDPRYWMWGSGDRMPHCAVLLYALPGCLEARRLAIEAQCTAGFELLQRLGTTDMGGKEPFGFTDGISQPQLDWDLAQPASDRTQLEYTNLSCLGEFLLGYPNEYGLYTPRPLLDPSRDTRGLLPRAPEVPDRSDLGRNGSYLVVRQLRQDVSGFWRALDRCAAGDAAERERLAAAMVGRTRPGQPIVDPSSATQNNFTYGADPDGIRCPLGAHIRRTNPRNADLPAGAPGILSRLVRTLGFDAAARGRDLVSSTRYHRLLRRGREYGTAMSIDQALRGAAGETEVGLHFMCLNANIQRQFEFVQNAWIIGNRFNGLHDESDPLLGNRRPGPGATPSDGFSMPQSDGPARRLSAVPQFVTVAGGAYFFLPGIRALRFLASA
jgi:deferrochelatase/peroxidase EfeB